MKILIPLIVTFLLIHSYESSNFIYKPIDERFGFVYEKDICHYEPHDNSIKYMEYRCSKTGDTTKFESSSGFFCSNSNFEEWECEDCQCLEDIDGFTLIEIYADKCNSLVYRLKVVEDECIELPIDKSIKLEIQGKKAVISLYENCDDEDEEERTETDLDICEELPIDSPLPLYYKVRAVAELDDDSEPADQDDQDDNDEQDDKDDKDDNEDKGSSSLKMIVSSIILAFTFLSIFM